jgi:hypothetical protein
LPARFAGRSRSPIATAADWKRASNFRVDVAAAYKVITEGILFEWVTHRKPDMSDLYLIHQQGWEGVAEHISQPDRIAWKSMCATSEGREKGEKWCKRAIWRNTFRPSNRRGNRSTS